MKFDHTTVIVAAITIHTLVWIVVFLLDLFGAIDIRSDLIHTVDIAMSMV